MKKIVINLFVSLLAFIFIIACESKPKVIEGQPVQHEEPAVNSNPHPEMPAVQNEISDGHLVVVNEVLNTEKYSYLNVTENGDKYWIAIPKKEVQLGSTYYYKGGLLKKNFESKEYNRVFETIYLVSDVIPHPSNSGGTEKSKSLAKNEKPGELLNITPEAGSIKLSELFSDPGKYAGKLIQVTGKCVKVNPKIMGRNWVHIQDGTGEGLDLTITTAGNVQIDDIVSFEGTISLNRDFGAGYKYDVIMEMAILK